MNFKRILNDNNKEMVQEFLFSFYENLYYALGFKTLKIKLVVSMMFSLLWSPVIFFSEFLRNYFVPDEHLLKTVIALCFFDSVIGAAKSIKQKRFNWLILMIGIMTKLMVSYIATVILKLMTNHEEMTSSADFEMYFILVGKLMIMMYPSISAFNNLHYLTNGKFPPVWYMERYDSFNKTGKVDDLLGKDKKEDNA